ncbi:MAG: VanW family protein [Candidatus Peribacteraceae bacterium]|nr:VanW family protein [Candidatus Peribacteraceae bacterium]
MRPFLRIIVLLSAIAAFSPAALASPGEILYRYQHHLFTLRPSQYPAWRVEREVWFYHGKRVEVPAEFRVDGDDIPPVPPGFVRTTEVAWNRDAIRAVIQEKIAQVLDRPAGAVTISRTASGMVVFDGVGMLGRKVDVDQATLLTVAALTDEVADITLPVEEIQPQITVTDPTLREQGIREVVSVGESDFTGSHLARKHNIGVGLKRFDGFLLPQGDTFSFDTTLGPVNQKTGYLKELVILGDKTLPDYGGGLCQVSTTAYRGVWEYGFPIVQRRNHSFAVRYYGPQGTDATVYPPHVDMKFLNDSPGALLIQTYTEGTRAYFIYYGTRDARTSEIVGPYTWDHQAPPPDRVEYTTDIPEGTTRRAGERVPGMKAMWYRILAREGGEEEVEQVYSVYEARPQFDQFGISPLALPAGGGSSSSQAAQSSARSSQASRQR